MASRIPALPRDSHVQSHAAVHKNKLCDSHAHLAEIAIACGWTRPFRDIEPAPKQTVRTAGADIPGVYFRIVSNLASAPTSR